MSFANKTVSVYFAFVFLTCKLENYNSSMISISTKSRYGLRAVLALAEFHGQGLLSIKELATRHDIPRQYLEQIFNLLGKANIIQSVRGKHGGYRLARSPEMITASEVILQLEGRIEFASESSDHTDAITNLFNLAEKKLLEIFDISLAELVNQQQHFNSVISYDI